MMAEWDLLNYPFGLVATCPLCGSTYILTDDTFSYDQNSSSGDIYKNDKKLKI